MVGRQVPRSQNALTDRAVLSGGRPSSTLPRGSTDRPRLRSATTVTGQKSSIGEPLPVRTATVMSRLFVPPYRNFDQAVVGLRDDDPIRSGREGPEFRRRASLFLVRGVSTTACGRTSSGDSVSGQRFAERRAVLVRSGSSTGPSRTGASTGISTPASTRPPTRLPRFDVRETRSTGDADPVRARRMDFSDRLCVHLARFRGPTDCGTGPTAGPLTRSRSRSRRRLPSGIPARTPRVRFRRGSFDRRGRAA